MMDHDLQCNGVLTDSFFVSHRFDNHMVNVKDYINEEMNIHLASAPNSYDMQNNVILKPRTQWTLSTSLQTPPVIDSTANFQENDENKFKFVLIDGTSNYNVTANPYSIPLSTDVIPYVFRNTVSISREEFKNLYTEPDVANVYVTLYTSDPRNSNPVAQEPGLFFEKHIYDLFVKVRIDQAPTDELLFVLETSDSSIGELSLQDDENTTSPCVFQFLEDEPLEQVHRICLTTKEVQNRDSSTTEYPCINLDLCIRAIKYSSNCHIMMKKWPNALKIQDVPVISDVIVTNTHAEVASSWEQIFATNDNVLRITFNSTGPLSQEPTIMFDILDQNNEPLVTQTLSGGTIEYVLWNQYKWTYFVPITSEMPNGSVRVRIEEQEEYHVQT